VVDRPCLLGEHRREQGLRGRVRGQDVQASVVDHGRHLGHPREDAGHARANGLGGGPTAGAGRGTGGAGEVGQVRLLGLVELQRARQGVQHVL